MLKYQGIADALRREIECGLYLPGEQIPLEETLGRQFRVCRGTVKRAMDLLVAQGLLARRRGAGAFVKALPGADVKELSMAHQLSGFAKTYRKDKVTTRCIRFSVLYPSEAVAAKLHMSSLEFVYDIVRVRYANAVPSVIEYTKMPVRLIPGIEQEVLLHSIYDYIEYVLQLHIQSAHRTVRSRMPTKLEKAYLEIAETLPVLEVEQVAFLDDGRPFEYSISHHRADKSVFRAVSVR